MRETVQVLSIECLKSKKQDMPLHVKIVERGRLMAGKGKSRHKLCLFWGVIILTFLQKMILRQLELKKFPQNLQILRRQYYRGKN